MLLFVTPWTVARQAPLSMGILQARILEWVAMPSSRGSTRPRDQTQFFCIAGGFFTVWATREASNLLIAFAKYALVYDTYYLLALWSWSNYKISLPQFPHFHRAGSGLQLFGFLYFLNDSYQIMSAGSDQIRSVSQLYLTLCDPMDCNLPGSTLHGDSPGKNTGVGCHALLQEIFPTPG